MPNHSDDIYFQYVGIFYARLSISHWVLSLDLM